MYVDGSGNVGVGNSAPGSRLDVASAGATTIRITNTDTTLVTDQTVGRLAFYPSDASANGTGEKAWLQALAEDVDGQSVAISLGTSDTAASEGVERMRITSAGFVGIGDTTPVSLLTVGAGDAFQVNSSGVVLSGTWNGTDIDISDYSNLSVSNGITLTGDVLSVTAAGGLAQTTGGLTTTGVLEDLNTLGPAAADGEFIVATGAGTFAYESGATVRTSLGLVAGGDGDIWVEKAGDTMSGGLTFSGTAANIALGSNFLSGDGGDEGVFVDSSGNVGIGTTTLSASSKLTLAHSGGADMAMIQGLETDGGPNTAFILRSDFNGHGQLELYMSGSKNVNLAAWSGEDSYINAGYFGIGTAAPAVRLHVMSTSEQFRLGYNTSVYWSDTIASDGGRTTAGFGSDADLNINLTGATDGDFSINSDDLFVDTSTGYVGIGTTSPSSELTFGASDSDITLDSTDGSDNERLAISGGGGSSWARGASIFLYGNEHTNTGDLDLQAGNVSGGDILLSSGGAERMRLTNAGLVGIGTTSPLTTLHITKDGGVLSTIPAPAAALIVERSTNSMISVVTGDAYGSYLSLGGATTPRSFEIIQDNSTGDTDFTNYVSGDVTFQTGGADRLTIDGSTGYVGIGTTTPAEKLSILSTDNSANTNIFGVRSNNLTAGVGIGYNTVRGLGSSQNLILDSGTGTGDTVLATGGAYRLTVDGSTGYVGIGTTSPLTTLSIANSQNQFTIIDSNSTGTSYTGGTLISSVDGFLKISGISHAGSGSAVRLTLDQTNGYLGIGTTTPAYALDVYGSSGVGISQDGTVRLEMFGHTSLGQGIVGTDSNHPLALRTNNSTQMLIDTSGNVGIGTTTPVAKLNVLSTTEQLRLAYSSSVYWSDTIASDGGRTLSGFGSDGDLNITFTGATDGDFSINGDDLFVDTSAGGLVGIGNTTPAAFLHIGSASNSLGGTAGNDLDLLTLHSVSSNADYLLFTTERLSTGTDWTSAAQRIQRQVDATPMGYMQFGSITGDLVTFGENATEYMRINGDGNVGIGTSTILGKLHVDNGASTNNVFFSNNSSLLRFANASGINYIQSAAANTTGSAASLYFTNMNSSSIWMVIHSGGNIGIGTTTPSAKLSVAGVSGSTNDIFAVASSSNARYMTVTSAGNVGIGSTTPSYNLTVAEDIYAGEEIISMRGTANANIRMVSGNYGAMFRNDGTTVYYLLTASGNQLGAWNDLRPLSINNSTGDVTLGTTTVSTSLTVTNDVAANGTYYYGDSKPIVQYSDTWLRLNPTNAFSSGIYANTGIFRTDGTLQVGSSGATLNVISGGDLSYKTNLLYGDYSADSIGIGTTTPSAKLAIAGTSGSAGDIFAVASSSNERYLTVTSAGNVGIGTSTSIAKLSIYGGNSTAGEIYLGNWSNASYNFISLNGSTNIGFDYNLLSSRGGSGQNLFINRPTGGDIRFRENNTDQMTILTGGFVGIGTAAPERMLHIYDATPHIRLQDTVNGDSVAALLEIYSNNGTRTGYVGDGSGANANMYILSDAGNVTIGGTGGTCSMTGAASGGSCFSDSRLKTVTGEIDSALEGLSTLKLVNFYWNQTAHDVTNASTTILNTGFIAQDVEAVFPELVYTNEEGYKTLDYGTLSMYNTVAINELNVRTQFLEGASSTVASFDGDSQTFWSRLTALAQGFVDGVLTITGAHIEYVQSEQIKTNELCVGNVCVNENTFLEMVQSANGAYALETPPVEASGGGSTSTGGGDTTATSTDPVIENGGSTTEPVVEEVIQELPVTEEVPAETPPAEEPPAPEPAL
ncbi:hypothetical protein A2392_00770 [Candidatus Kaiserbacteria bacterium RIFOXYB1_FULL_46_14]|uniref:Peptidase S74 domain-containing protein n=1 Tax=Candidatus Kaiserbacteria bacterium RIFOXYB1_FULL_46_14 TaxID=1798531 RepID=A0A1F6FJF9_9BACT|nr:MAG: hypothetical protein A2392_00770 [Candidatus Kaiserbacteria bacterium RIFOXYB1_FULL_46_14]